MTRETKPVADAPVIKSGITLAVIAAICTALVALTYQLTRDRITANEQAWLEQSLQPALSGLFFDSGVSESKITIPAPHELPGSEDAVIYRVFSGDSPVAALFVVNARDGYAGAIRLLVGIDIDGAITGVSDSYGAELDGGSLSEGSALHRPQYYNGNGVGCLHPDALLLY